MSWLSWATLWSDDPTYRKQVLTDGGADLPAPSIEALTGLKLFAREPVEAVMRAQDKVAWSGHRVVCDWGNGLQYAWRVPNTDPDSNSRTHPDRTTWYAVARTRCELTPGHFLECNIACLPSGETQRAATAGEGAPSYRADGPHGRVRITGVWYDLEGDSETTVHEIALPVSTLQYGAESTDDGALYRDIRTVGPVVMRPPGVTLDKAELRRFSRGGTIDVTVEVQGSPRIVDGVVQELPDLYAIADEDDAAIKTQHVFAEGAPDGAVAPKAYYREVNSATDPRGGARQVLATARAQAEMLGPMLFSWSGYDEHYAGATSTIVARTTSNDGSTFEDIMDSSRTSWSADAPGFGVSCGGYARRWKDSNYWILRDRIAVVPVIVRVYGRTITAGVGTVRVQSSPHDWVDVDIPVSGSNGWHTGYGWLQCGLNPSQHSNAMVLFNHAGASGSLSIESVTCYVCNRPSTITR